MSAEPSRRADGIPEVRGRWWDNPDAPKVDGWHAHPLTGVRCDYYWHGKRGPEPRWRGDVFHKGRDKADWWYTCAEVAMALGVHRRTVTSWVDRGLLPGAVRFGPWPRGKIRIQGRAVDAFLRSQAIHAPLPTGAK